MLNKSRRVVDVISESTQLLQEAGVDEAAESVFQLLADVLHLSWESGFRELRDAYYSTSRISTDTTANTPLYAKPIDGNAASLLDSAQKPPVSGKALMDRILTTGELDHWQKHLERRLKHEPLQYILGQWDFLDYTLNVRAPLLCPRPETEELVLLALQSVKEILSMRHSNDAETKVVVDGSTTVEPQLFTNKKVRILDVGCGTGCIGTALCAEIAKSFPQQQQQHHTSQPLVHVTALDVDPVAVSVATENAQRILGMANAEQQYQAILMAAEDFDPTAMLSSSSSLKMQAKAEAASQLNNRDELLFDLVVSNPPYILPSEMDTLDATVRNYENHVALSGLDPDGMCVIRQIVQALPKWCNANAICWMEVHPTHPVLLQQWLSSTAQHQPPLVPPPQGVKFVQTVKDFLGNDRFVQLRVIK
ncbi:hypothetical protein ACA910_014923 [Epithemia clementina (nom. ined.)]